jgi:hypothetical protein
LPLNLIFFPRPSPLRTRCWPAAHWGVAAAGQCGYVSGSPLLRLNGERLTIGFGSMPSAEQTASCGSSSASRHSTP